MNFDRKNIIILIIFILLQTIWFNQVKLFGTFTPIIYIYPFLILPADKYQNIQLFLGFLTGLILDSIIHTGGVFSAVTVAVVFFKNSFFTYYKKNKPNFNNPLDLEFSNKLLYYGIFILLSTILIFYLQSFELKWILNKFYWFFINTIISLFLMIFIEYIFLIKNKI